MENVTLFPIMQRGAEHIMIKFAPLKTLNDVIKRLPSIKWSQTYKWWYLPMSEENYNAICQVLRGLAHIHTEYLRKYLIKRKAVKAIALPPSASLKYAVEEKRLPTAVALPALPEPCVAYRLSYENLIDLQQTIKQLTLKAYSYSTIRTYRGELMVFFQALGKVPAARITSDDMKRWLVKCLADGLTENTMHSRINALKFYYEQVLGREKFFFDIPRPKKWQQLPRVLGQEEITRLFNAVLNKKHKAILFTAYSAGLRVSEVVN